MSQLKRATEVVSYDMQANRTDASDHIDMSSVAGGRVYIPAGYASATLTYSELIPGTSTLITAADKNGTAITQTVAAGNSYPIPEDLFGAQKIVIAHSNGADDDTVIKVTLKS